MDKKYRELHNEYIKALVDYHNAYLNYIEGSKAKVRFHPVRRSLGVLKKLNTLLIRELGEVRKGKVALNADRYQEQRSRKGKKDDNNSSN